MKRERIEQHDVWIPESTANHLRFISDCVDRVKANNERTITSIERIHNSIKQVRRSCGLREPKGI